MSIKSSAQTKSKLLVSIGILTMIIALPLLIAFVYQPTISTFEPQVAGAQTTNHSFPDQPQIDLNQDGQVDILDYTIQTSHRLIAK